MVNKSIQDRFWSKVRKTDTCWLWLAQLNTQGYGVFHYHRRGHPAYRSPQIYAHRLSWMFENGQFPEGLEIIHKCDTPACINPDHLTIGTHGENMRDMVYKKRHQYGENHALAKLNVDVIRQIRNDPRSSRKAAPDYRIAASTIRGIRNGRHWKHVT